MSDTFLPVGQAGGNAPSTIAVMKAARRWLLWQEVIRPGKSKPDKVPFYIDGTNRCGKLDSPEDLVRLATYSDAKAAMLKCGPGWHLGFALGPDGEGGCWQGIDFDNIDDNLLAGFVDGLPGYVEWSPSGDGVHAIGYGLHFRSLGSNSSGVEAYGGGRFFTFTGNVIRDAEIICLADHVETVLAPIHRAASRSTSDATARREGAVVEVSPQTVSHLRSALLCLRADDRHRWIRMGMALRELGEVGRGLWLDWSATSEKFDPLDAARTWESFEPNETSYPAVFAEAQRRGWINPASNAARIADRGNRSTISHPVALDLKSLPALPPPVPFVIPGWLPSNVVTLFSAHGGAGKSFVALYVAVCVAIGRNPFQNGESIPRRRVLFYSAEDGLPHLQGRLRRYLTYLGVREADLDGWLVIFDATGSDNVLFRQGKNGCKSTDRFDWLAAKISDFAVDLLIFDNASDALDANENDRAAVRQFMSSLLHIAPTVLLLAHVDAASSMARPRNAKGYSGSTAWHNSARSRWFLNRDEGGTLTLGQPKVNYSRSGSEVILRWDDDHGVFAVTGSYDRALDAGRYRSVLLGLFGDALREGETISPHRTANNNFLRAIRNREGFPQGLDSAAIYKELALWKREGLVQYVDYKSSNRQLLQRLEMTDAGQAAAAAAAF